MVAVISGIVAILVIITITKILTVGAGVLPLEDTSTARITPACLAM